MRRSLLAMTLPAAATLLLAGTVGARAQTLIASYNFDSATFNGTYYQTSANAGSQDATALDLYEANTSTSTSAPNAATTVNDINDGTSNAVAGVSGLAGDYALNLAYGTPPTGGITTNAQSVNNGGVAGGTKPGSTTLIGQASYANWNSRNSPFTVTGWFNPAAVSGANAAFNGGNRLFDGTGFLVLATSGNILELQLGGSTYKIDSASYTPVAGQWEFFAITYNGTGTATGTATFYQGTLGGALMQNLTGTVTPNGTASSTTSLTIGNTNNLNRAFNGSMDDVAFYSGALTSNQINAIYSANKLDSAVVLPAAAPEPGSLAFIALGGLGFAGTILRRRRAA